MSFLIKMLIRMGLLKDDLDYHLMRASMVLIFAFFGYQKWFEYEAQAVPRLRHPWGNLVSGRGGMVVWPALVLRFLE